MHATLFGAIHSFILPSVLTEGKNPPSGLFIRRIVHYFHNAFVLEDSSDTEHLPSLTNMDGVQAIISLFTLAIYFNVLDERTYEFPSGAPMTDHNTLLACHQLYDLNAIPVIERHHACHARGLAFDLVNWLFDHYAFSDTVTACDDVDAYTCLLVPFTVHVGRQIIRYKIHTESTRTPTSITSQELTYQVECALYLDGMKDAYEDSKAIDDEIEHNDNNSENQIFPYEFFDLDLDLSSFSIRRRDTVDGNSIRIDEYLETGQNIADKKFFLGLACNFNLEESGKCLYNYFLF